MFKKLENNRPFLKMAFQGFAGDGKTFTATQVAIGLHKLIKSQKPVAIFDTEEAAKALVDIFKDAKVEVVAATGQRSLAALNQAIKWCEAGNADILIVDSITHVWEEYLAAYMAEKRRSRLEFQDWGIIKPKWKREFSTPFVQAKVHIIFTGRAGYEYSDERNEETGKREIFKSGIKMKAETETAFEPDILVLMEKQMDIIGKDKKVTREATILKDRTNRIDGKTFINPTYKDFAPAINSLLSGEAKDDNNIEVIRDTFQDAESKMTENRMKRGKTIAEIEGVFTLMGLGTAVKDKQLKAAILNKIWKVVSIDKLDDIKVADLEAGLAGLRKFSDAYAEYLKNCADMEVAPENKQIAELLETALAEAQANAELFV